MAQDVYTWRIKYDDGTFTNEYDESRPDGRGFAEREEKPVRSVQLLRTGTAEVEQWFAVPEGAEPVFFRRRSVTFNPLTGAQESQNTVHCIGCKQDERALYLFVFDNGETLLTSELQAV